MLFRRPHGTDEDLERAKARFDAIVAEEIEARAKQLEQTLQIARAESVSILAEEERRITEERRRDVAERERDASTRLGETLTAAERRVEERVARWGADLESLQENLAGELARVGQRLKLLTADAEVKITEESERLSTTVDEHRALVAKLREDFERSTQAVTKEAASELDQHAAERRRALHEVAERLRRRER